MQHAAPSPLKLGSSPSLAMAVKLVADFWCTDPSRVRLESEPSAGTPRRWIVRLGDRLMPEVEVIRHRGRFVFQRAAGAA